MGHRPLDVRSVGYHGQLGKGYLGKKGRGNWQSH